VPLFIDRLYAFVLLGLNVALCLVLASGCADKYAAFGDITCTHKGKLIHYPVNSNRFSKTTLIFYSKAYFNRDLKVGDFAIHNVAACFNDFKPVQVF